MINREGILQSNAEAFFIQVASKGDSRQPWFRMGRSIAKISTADEFCVEFLMRAFPTDLHLMPSRRKMEADWSERRDSNLQSLPLEITAPHVSADAIFVTNSSFGQK